MWNVNAWRPAQPGDFAWDDRLLRGQDAVEWVVPGSDPLPDWFRPDFGSDQMIRMGVFGQAYFGGAMGRERLAMLQPGHPVREAAWPFRDIRGRQCKDVNRHGRKASLPREWWLHRGLIFDYDPLGWFEWLVWYEQGRRLPSYDHWQMLRWARFKQRQGRHYIARPQPGQAQALLHWGIDAGRLYHAAATGGR